MFWRRTNGHRYTKPLVKALEGIWIRQSETGRLYSHSKKDLNKTEIFDISDENYLYDSIFDQQQDSVSIIDNISFKYQILARNPPIARLLILCFLPNAPK